MSFFDSPYSEVRRDSISLHLYNMELPARSTTLLRFAYNLFAFMNAGIQS